MNKEPEDLWGEFRELPHALWIVGYVFLYVVMSAFGLAMSFLLLASVLYGVYKLLAWLV